MQIAEHAQVELTLTDNFIFKHTRAYMMLGTQKIC